MFVNNKKVGGSLKDFRLHPGVNSTNILRAAFTRADPKIVKKTVKLSSFIALLGSAHIKAARRTLVKLTPSVFGIQTETIVKVAK